MARPEIKKVQLDLDQRKDMWVFPVWLDGLQVAELKAMPEGEHVVVHLTVHAWSRELCREYLCCFAAVRMLLRESGCKLMLACSDRSNKKMLHFWRLMGFRVFGELELQGTWVAYAVMEV